MTDGLAAVVLAAGAGRRLRPLSLRRPKVLCPVGNVPLLDLAIERVRPAVDDLTRVAVNVHHGRRAIDDHLAGRTHLSVEADRPMGTAGALGHLRGWLDGRDALVVNADAWCPGSLAAFVDGWDRERIRLLLAGEDEVTPRSGIAGALMPWSAVAELASEPSGLWEVSWRAALAAGRLQAVRHDGPFVDCGTPAQYLAANLGASGGDSVVGEGAVVEGALDRCVIWAGAPVHAAETLVCAIRADDHLTVLVR